MDEQPTPQQPTAEQPTSAPLPETPPIDPVPPEVPVTPVTPEAPTGDPLMVEIENKDYAAATQGGGRPEPISWLVRLLRALSGGRITTDKQANKVAIVFIIAGMLLTAFLLYQVFKPAPQPQGIILQGQGGVVSAPQK